jgi:hypothetical protein
MGRARNRCWPATPDSGHAGRGKGLIDGLNEVTWRQYSLSVPFLMLLAIKIGATKLMGGGLTSLVLGAGLPAKDYVDLMQQVPDAGAIVSFVGPPNLPPEELQKLQAGHPPLVVVDTFGVLKGRALPAMVEAKAVALAFEPLNSLEAEKEKQQASLFDRYYRILRPPAQSP